MPIFEKFGCHAKEVCGLPCSLFQTPGKQLVLQAFFVLSGLAWGGSIAVAQSKEIVLRFGGDLLLGGRYEEGVGADIERAFADFELFKTDDISLVNLENPVTTRGTRRIKPYTFRMHPRFVPVLKAAGIDVVTIANNHVNDFGKTGLFDTIAALDSAHIAHVGAGSNHHEAHRPFTTTIDGRKIGILGYYSGGEAPRAVGRKPGVAARDLRLIKRDIRALRKGDSVHYVIVTFHWGKEKAEYPDRKQRSFAREAIDAGADAVIGHHPHVLQGIELYKGKPIVYSLGNLVFGGNHRHSYDTGVFEIRYSEKGATYMFLPVRVERWKARSLAGSSGDSIVNNLRKLSSIFAQSISQLTTKEIQ